MKQEQERLEKQVAELLAAAEAADAQEDAQYGKRRRGKMSPEEHHAQKAALRAFAQRSRA